MWREKIPEHATVCYVLEGKEANAQRAVGYVCVRGQTVVQYAPMRYVLEIKEAEEQLSESTIVRVHKTHSKLKSKSRI